MNHVAYDKKRFSLPRRELVGGILHHRIRVKDLCGQSPVPGVVKQRQDATSAALPRPNSVTIITIVIITVLLLLLLSLLSSTLLSSLSLSSLLSRVFVVVCFVCIHIYIYIYMYVHTDVHIFDYAVFSTCFVCGQMKDQSYFGPTINKCFLV